MTQACIKLDDKKAIEGILNIIKNLSTDNISNLDHIAEEHWYDKQWKMN